MDTMPFALLIAGLAITGTDAYKLARREEAGWVFFGIAVGFGLLALFLKY